ncbi:AAA family ATPase [Agarivorans sp. MS3-6]
MQTVGELVFFCGKMGAGKSTYAKQLADQHRAVLISEDEWLAVLYPQQIASFEDYLRYSALLKKLIKPHVQHILRSGADVVMDYPANTRKQRAWFKQLLSEVKASHQLIYLKADDDLCLSRIAQRAIEQPQRAAFDKPEVFHHVTQYFEVPNSDEGLCVETKST